MKRKEEKVNLHEDIFYVNLNDENASLSCSSNDSCDQFNIKNVPEEIWKKIFMQCDTKTKMSLMGTSKQFRLILNTEEFWREIVVEELPRLKDNIYLNQNEFQDIETLDQGNEMNKEDRIRFGLSPKGWKDTIKMYGTFAKALFDTKRGIWNDVYHLKESITHPKTSLLLFTVSWVSLASFLFLFFFAIFYSTNFIRGPVFDKLSDDPNVSNLVSNKVTRSVFSFSLSQSKLQFTVVMALLLMHFGFLFLYLTKRKEVRYKLIFVGIYLACFPFVNYLLCLKMDNLMNGENYTPNIRNRLVDGPMAKSRSAVDSKKSDAESRGAFSQSAADEEHAESGQSTTEPNSSVFESSLWLLFALLGEIFFMSPVENWVACYGDEDLNGVILLIAICGVITAWVLFFHELCFNTTNSWTVVLVPLFPTIVLIHVFVFFMRPSKEHDYSVLCSKSIRIAGIAIGSVIGIAIVLIPLLCLDGIGVFDPRASNGEAWKGAERFMSAVVVTDELIERAHKMERNMALSLVPMVVWFVIVMVAFWAALYLVKGDVKWIERNVDLRKELFVWQDAARKRRSREEQERRAEEWKRRRMEKMREKQKEEEKKAKEAKKAKKREMREEEKEQRLAEIALKGLKPEELSAAIDEIDAHYDQEEREEIEAEEAERKRLEEEAKKRKEEEEEEEIEKAKQSAGDHAFDEPGINSVIHETWQQILQRGSFSWLL
ncbi:uncharacterized protein MONOS_15062 [Monocercomonoides exilis]|uniref:uncharacterized protein n=1 Tax=Monocercomonoides exilis TaxID=2049356 RepID=UPI00355A2C1A|nr:hypothetical protein MONOS_15062 [Monocercomonoides exilis]|eukprot:MONOS_15062.1-p1 / transcript=MONOS_15062.1 / gene=MONOS_15062 / organism=Monocercomonoides_exilis_PA203 / gene_product=unspecified product / transcript_product=unspecified product / location=Mono_scaffold01136:7613-10110(-) / protein_length=714 / sequence_SO=supercontig / SO=protein_coding / is_pseudo=false